MALPKTSVHSRIASFYCLFEVTTLGEGEQDICPLPSFLSNVKPPLGQQGPLLLCFIVEASITTHSIEEETEAWHVWSKITQWQSHE